MKISRRGFFKLVLGASATVAVTLAALFGTKRLPSVSVLFGSSSSVLWKTVTIKVNGKDETLKVKANWTLLKVLREDLVLTGTKAGCLNSVCGACTVLIDGLPVYSCHKLAMEVDAHEVTTIEGLSDGGPTPLQQAFIENGAFQCGYCTPGMVVAAAALLKANPNPAAEDVVRGLSGNICRCSAYPQIVRAVLSVAQAAR